MLRQLGKDAAIYGSADFLFKLIAFAVFPVYAHVFSVADFGVMALVTVSAAVLAAVANTGLNNAVQRFYWDPATDEARQPVMVTTGLVLLTASCVLTVGVALTALHPLRGVIHSRYGIEWLIIVLASLTVISDQLLQYALDTTRLHFAPLKFALISFLKNLFGAGIGLVLILAYDAGLAGFFYGGLLGTALAVLPGLYWIRKDLVARFDLRLARELIGFGYPFIFAALAFWALGSLDRWMLAELADNVQVGLYSIAFKFATVILFLNGAFGQAWSPFAIKVRRDHADYRELFSRILSLWFFGLTVIGMGLALFSPELLKLLTPEEYWPAVPALVICVMSTVLLGTTQVTALGISLEGKTRLFAKAAWLTLLANICLNLALIPPLGAVGAAAATFVSNGLLAALYLRWSQQLHPIPLETRKLLYTLGVAVAVVPLSMGLALAEWGVHILFVKTLVVALTVAGGMWSGILDNALIGKVLGLRKGA